ncbi:MAG TPA: trypsin-like peptidase domain-containing protein [Gaiellaceae bacterium]|nr:trypsin-like peptidase domain-containing protein [Gaiellaceae bacterium]
MTRILAITATLLAAAAAALGAYAVTTDGGTSTTVRQVTVTDSQPAATTNPLSVTGVYNRTYKGVVEITVSSSSPTPFGGRQEQEAQGSGFVYDAAGHIVTNEHVVDGAQSVSVRFWNGATYKASVVGTDPSTDLAVIKVNAPASVLQPVALGDSSDLQVGQGVVAIGSPFGLEGTTTAGIVSALHRQMEAPNNFTINNSIQTDAAINHGNSGGPLLDLTGKVIGVNAQIRSDSGDNAGVGFAIPSNTVRAIASQLISTGNVQHAYLGVGIANATDGVRLTDVRLGTPAARAGLRAGDVVTAVNGKAVGTAEELSSSIDAKKPGDRVTLKYERNGQTKSVTVTLAERPS